MSTSSSLLSTLSPSSNSSNQNNITDEERRRYLDLLQKETTLLMIPTVVFLTVIAIVGLFGNSMVLLVYSRKPRHNATDVFIMAIAAFDLTTNVLAIPGEIYDTFHQWDIDKPALCKCRLYVNAFTTMSSALVLLAVAVCRYKKVCRPLGKQTSIGTAKCLIPAMALVCSICAAPQAILAGSQTVPTGHEDISGYLCLTDDKYDGTIWPIIYSGFMMLLFLGTCIPLIVLYMQIAIQAWHHSKRNGVSRTSMSATNSDAAATETLDSNDDKRKRKSNNRRFKFFKNNEDFDIRRPSMQGDDPTLFLNDEGKTEDFGIRTDVANGKTSDRSGDFALDSNLREKMADTHKTEIKVRIEKKN